MSIEIVCTIGPASEREEVLEQLMKKGMTIARLNMSHGQHEMHQQTIHHVRKLSTQLDLPIRILADLQGPKIRLGEVAGTGVELTAGQPFILRTKPIVGNEEEASVDYPGLSQDMKPGADILINDGEVRLKVKRITGGEVETEVTTGGNISSHKGVNVPGTHISLPALTKKDHEDLQLLLHEQIDMVACSFIREASNIEEIRRFVQKRGKHNPNLIAKIETIEGLCNFSQIAKASDGIMIARGDLGVEVPFTWLPLLQKVLLSSCKQAHKFVITATQMLQSMVEHQMPTRAEVTDVFQAVLDGTDAVMLSAETAAGQYPVKSVETMQMISSFAEWAKGEQPYDIDDMLRLLQGFDQVRM